MGISAQVSNAAKVALIQDEAPSTLVGTVPAISVSSVSVSWLLYRKPIGSPQVNLYPDRILLVLRSGQAPAACATAMQISANSASNYFH